MESVFQFWRHVERKTKGLVPLQVFEATVKDVDEEQRTCTVTLNGNVDFEDVRLYAVSDDSLKGFCLIPKKDSTVLVARIANGNGLYVTMFSEVDKVLGTIGDKVELSLDEKTFSYMSKGDGDKSVTLKITDGKVTIEADEIVFNGGENGGLVNIGTLTEKIQAIENDLNDIKIAIAEWVPTAQDGGAGLKGVLVDWCGATFKGTKQDDYEDTSIKH